MQKIIGEKFGRWTVIAGAESRNSSIYCLCECECGTTREVMQRDLLQGWSSSCGCLSREQSTSHGMSKHRLYHVWRAMIMRCTDTEDSQYKYYGGRNITVCEEWLDVRNFITWAEPLWRKGLQLDRVNNDLGYSPGNCRFVTPEININNQRPRYNVTGYTGIAVRYGKFTAVIYSNRPPCNGKLIYLGVFNTKEEAVIARNNFIIEHNLPHKIQVIDL